MGDMTLGDFRTAVRMSLQARSDILEEQITRWVYWAYRYVSHPSFQRHEELRYAVSRTLVEGDFMLNMAVGGTPRVVNLDGILTMPAVGFEIAGVDGVYISHITQGPNSTECPYTKLVPGDTRMFDLGQGPRGIPTRYAIRTGDVWFSAPAGPQVVGDRMSARVWGVPNPMTDNLVDTFPGYGADKTVIQTIWDDPIVLLARWRGMVELGMPPQERAASFQEFVAISQPIREHSLISAEDWKSSSYELTLIPYQGDARG